MVPILETIGLKVTVSLFRFLVAYELWLYHRTFPDMTLIHGWILLCWKTSLNFLKNLLDLFFCSLCWVCNKLCKLVGIYTPKHFPKYTVLSISTTPLSLSCFMMTILLFFDNVSTIFLYLLGTLIFEYFSRLLRNFVFICTKSFSGMWDIWWRISWQNCSNSVFITMREVFVGMCFSKSYDNAISLSLDITYDE